MANRPLHVLFLQSPRLHLPLEFLPPGRRVLPNGVLVQQPVHAQSPGPMLRRGWCLGSQSFRREMLLQMEGRLGEHQAGELLRASAEAKAARIIAEERDRQGWQEADRLPRSKSTAIKLEIAARLKQQTTLSTKAIAAPVHLESSKAANRSVHSYLRRGGAISAVQGQMAL